MFHQIPLSTNGLVMPPDFPVASYESVYSKAFGFVHSANEVYSHFAGAWNAVAYRFLALTEYEREFTSAIADRSPSPIARHHQERQLFGFFSNGFSVFEAAFYGVFSLGALIAPTFFPIASAKDQQRINPTSAMNAIRAAFPSDPLNGSLNAITNDPAYIEWREIRNVLTHRAAPGRTFFVGGGGDDDLIPDQWKIKNISLDSNMAPVRREQLAILLTDFMREVDTFSKSNF
jgi:hypothetical protein